MEMRSVDRLLVGLLAATLVAAGAGAMLGLFLIGEDLQMSGEWLDGLGIMFGLGLLTLVAVPATAAVVALTKVRRTRPSAWRWALAAGLLGLVCGFPFGFFEHSLYVVLVLPLLVVLVAVESRRVA